MSADLIALIIVVAWYLWGPWIVLYGFAVYHSRGDVWLPTPLTVIELFRAMVLTETFVFAALFALASFLMFSSERFPLRDAFYGDWRKLLVKYCALLFSSIVLPYALNSMWKFRPTSAYSISTGLGITLATFIVLMVVADMLLARPAPQQQKARPNLAQPSV